MRSHALQVLEFQTVLQSLSLQAETAAGAELCAELNPSFNPKEVAFLLRQTQQAYELLGVDPPPTLAGVRSGEREFELCQKGSLLAAEEVYRMAETLEAIGKLGKYLAHREEPLGQLASVLPDYPKVYEKVFECVRPGGTIADQASPELSSIRQRKSALSGRVLERIQMYVSGRHRDLLSDPIYTTRDGRYVLPVKAENRGKIRGIIHDTSSSGATIYVEPDDVLQLGNQLRELEGAERAEEERILKGLCSRISTIAGGAIAGLRAAVQADVVFAKARFAYDVKAGIPEFISDKDSQAKLILKGARHPLLSRASTVPLDIQVGVGASVLITGPNTGGKTVAMKTVGLCVAMAQAGIFPPAIECRLSPFAGIFADIGDEQSLQQSLSTFSAHMKNMADAIRLARPGALMLFDEMGAGTDPSEGAALAIAILEQLHEAGCAILASTHFGELKTFAFQNEGFTNAAMEFDSKTLMPTYRLQVGSAGASHALRVAERFGVPPEVLASAKTHLGESSQEISVLMEKLDLAQRQARKAQGESDRLLNEARRTEQEADRKLKEAEAIRKQVRGREAEELQAELREIRLAAADIFESLKANPSERNKLEAKQQLDQLQKRGDSRLRKIRPEPSVQRGSPRIELVPGLAVKISGFDQLGHVLEAPKDHQVKVRLGSLKMTVPVARVYPQPESGQRQEALRAQRSKPSLPNKANVSFEIHLRRLRAEDAELELSRFLDDALLAGLPFVRIVHGKGEGVLRKITQDMLKKNKNIGTYQLADATQGGEGVTIATFK